MTLPANFLTAIASRHATLRWFVEWEGGSIGYGNFEVTTGQAATFFAGRASKDRLTAVKPWALRKGDEALAPEIEPTVLDHLGGRADLGSARVSIVDVDDSLAGLTAQWRSDGRVTLSGELSASETTSFTVVEDASAFPSSNGEVHIDREVIGYGSRSGTTFSTLTRAKYGTIATTHKGKTTSTGEARIGAGVTQYPRSLIGRTARVRFGFDTGGTFTDADMIDAAWGDIAKVEWTGTGQVLQITIDDPQMRLSRPIFTNIGENLKPHDTSKPITVLRAPPGYAVGFGWYFDNVSVDSVLAVDDVIYCMIGGRAIGAFKCTRAPPFVTFEFLGWMFGTEFPATPAGEPQPTDLEVRQVFLLSGVDDTERYSGMPHDLDNLHALEIALLVLQSTGDGTNDASGWPTRDQLPREWGIGFPVSRIDTAGFRKLIDRDRFRSMIFAITEPVKDARKWLVEQILRPNGYYLRTLLDGRISVGSLAAPSPDDVLNATALTVSDLHRTGGTFTKLAGPRLDYGSVVGSITIATSPALVDGKLELAPALTFSAGDTEFDTGAIAPGARTVEIEAYGLHGGRRLTGGGFEDTRVRGPNWGVAGHGDIVESIWSRFGNAPLVIDVACTLAMLDVEIGDLMVVTLANMPSMTSATRGLSSVYCEVVQKRVDLARGVVEFSLMQSRATIARTRYVAPAAIIAVTVANDSVTEITIDAEVFRKEIAGPDGTPFDTMAFEAGDKVRIYTADLSSRSGVFTIASVDNDFGTITLTVAPTTAIAVAGSVLIHADYGESTARVTAKYAHRAGGDKYLGTSDPAHEFAD
jgi:hypothetical protein